MLSIIAAVAKNRVIGKDNDLPWKLSADLKHFARITTGKSVLMGRKTYESIVTRLGHPLPNRKNYVLSRSADSLPGVELVKDLSVLENERLDEEIFIIGGASVYEQALPSVERLYLTEVDCAPEGDALFPAFEADDWKLLSEEPHEKDEKNEYNYNFKIYERK